MKDKEKTQCILNALLYNLSWNRSTILFPELRLGSGYCGVAQRRIDLFTISSSEGNSTTAYEIKVSRADFKHDIQNDLKQRGARLYSNYFYYITPKGMLKIDEVPIWAGLLEIDLDEYVENAHTPIKETVPAPLHSKAQPSWGLICSMVRHINKDICKQQVEEQQKEINTLNTKLNKAERLLGKLARKETDQFYDWQLAEYKTK